MESFTQKLVTDVRLALHHITGLIELAREERKPGSQSRNLAGCLECADDLLRKASDYAELDRPDVKTRTLVSFGLFEAVAEVAELMEVLARRKGLDFFWSVETSGLRRLRGDRLAIQDCLRRLLDNAIRYTSSGQVQLLVTAADMEGSSVVTFQITDTGPGIEHSAFWAGDSDSRNSVHGTGLRIVRKRVSGMGGNLVLESSSDEGTALKMVLPLSFASAKDRDKDEEAQTGKRASGPLSSPLKLLVAEDSEESFLLFQAYTQGEGHEIRRALNGAEAVHMAQSGDFDFVVMDINMPVMDGYTATAKIREWETEHRRKRMPILLLSADDEERQSCIGGAAGCSGYLTKPTNKAQIVEALRFYANPVAG